MSEDELNNLKLEVASFIAKVNEWMSSTTEYRKDLCRKLDELANKINGLPCEKGESKYNALEKQVGWIWGLLSAVIIIVISQFIKH